MSALYSNEIVNLARRLGIPLVGVFSKNLLPKAKHQGFYIVNLENDRDDEGNFLAGTHWVCFGLLPNKVFYFDSMGCDLPPLEIIEFLEPYEIFVNDTQVQALGTRYCGWFCLACCHYIYNHQYHLPELLYKFTDMFYHDLESVKNYKILIDYFKQNLMSL